VLKLQTSVLRRAAQTRSATRGLSLIELMVGITIGLIVVAGATLMAATQISDNRRLLLETQVQQDLRAAADIITREVRRTGMIRWADGTLWSSATPADLPTPNTLSRAVYGAGAEAVSYGYHRPGSGADNSLFFGFRLDSGVIRQRSGTSLQDLTDGTSLEVTLFTVVQTNPGITAQLACTRLCPDGTQNCWPTLSVSDVQVTITGRPRSAPELVRTVTSQVRLRNEGVQLGTGATQVCP
jgi:prepilin-type N-terminal cleavage/methylation domain-containing protein